MPSTARYDVFISYNRRQDGWLAPALQAGLERFAKPWYRMRALRVFRDTASLAASPELWGTIEAALRDSSWLILLASPEAAQSSWVDREVAWWLANKSADRMLIAATYTRLRWDKEAGDWAEDTPVPPSLRGASRAEPLWVDLTGVRPAGRRIRVPDEDLATLSAPLRGVDRDTLIGEHLRQHRRTMRVVRSVIATLTALLVSTVAATVVAVGQRDTARTQARIATARELAAVSGSLLGTHLDVAQLLAVAAYQTDRDPQTEGALMQAVAASPHLVRYLQAGATVTALAGCIGREDRGGRHRERGTSLVRPGDRPPCRGTRHQQRHHVAVGKRERSRGGRFGRDASRRLDTRSATSLPDRRGSLARGHRDLAVRAADRRP